MGEEGDRALVEAVLRGETAAFAALYRAHVAAVVGAIRGQVRDVDVVPDLVQTTFARALGRLHTLRDSDRFGPWLLTIARNTGIDHRRKRELNVVDDDRELASRDPTPDEVIELTDLAVLVQTCIAGLSVRDATAISLVSDLGFMPGEVAAVLGVTENAAKVIVHRARRRLRDALVLELMVRRRGEGCSIFQTRYGTSDIVGAARHVRGCPECLRLAKADVRL